MATREDLEQIQKQVQELFQTAGKAAGFEVPSQVKEQKGTWLASLLGKDQTSSHKVTIAEHRRPPLTPEEQPLTAEKAAALLSNVSVTDKAKGAQEVTNTLASSYVGKATTQKTPETPSIRRS